MAIGLGIVLVIVGILLLIAGGIQGRGSISRRGVYGPVGLIVIVVGAIVYLFENGYLSFTF